MKATEDLRQELYAKQLELKSELAKEDPDPKIASNIQNDISKLQIQLDQNRIDHMVKREIPIPTPEEVLWIEVPWVTVLARAVIAGDKDDPTNPTLIEVGHFER